MTPDLVVGRLSASTRGSVDPGRQGASLREDARCKERCRGGLFRRPGSGTALVHRRRGERRVAQVKAPSCASVERRYGTDCVSRIAPAHEANALAALAVPLVVHVSTAQISALGGKRDLTVGSRPSTTTRRPMDLEQLRVRHRRLRLRRGASSGSRKGSLRVHRSHARRAHERRHDLEALFENLFSPRSPTLGEAVETARAALGSAVHDETLSRWAASRPCSSACRQRIWKCQPTALAVTRPATVPLRPGAAVTVLAGGAPVESALVTAWKAGRTIARSTRTRRDRRPCRSISVDRRVLVHRGRPGLPFLDSLSVTASAGRSTRSESVRARRSGRGQ
jgi:hypothetical protein